MKFGTVCPDLSTDHYAKKVKNYLYKNIPVIPKMNPANLKSEVYIRDWKATTLKK